MEVTSAKGVIIINGRAYEAQKVIDVLLGNTYTSVKVEGTTLIIGNTRIQPVSKSVQELAMLRTCFGSLAYCCSPDKKCMDRDGALEHLGLTIEDFQQIKSISHQMFIDVSKRITDIHSLKNQMLEYHNEGETYEEKNVGSTHPRKSESGSFYVGSSRGYISGGDSSDDSSLEDKSYGPTDLSLIFSEPSKKDSSSSLDYESREGKASSTWSYSTGIPLVFGDRNDEREEKKEDTDHCIHCRAQVPLGARYCPNCGESVS